MGGDRDRKRTKTWDVTYQHDVPRFQQDNVEVFLDRGGRQATASRRIIHGEDDDDKVDDVEVTDDQMMTPEEAAAYRNYLQVEVHGKHAPNPIKTWNQTRLSTKIIETLATNYYDKPTPIQAQVLPVLMSGLDCLALTKPSCPGKILAFVLPMLAHIMDQPHELESGNGPIGLIIAPTTDLVQQIHAHIMNFTNVLGLRCVPVYQGSGAAQQLETSQGAEILVCTPHPMLYLLATKVTDLTRVSYLVIDEADRHVEKGFAPQVTMLVQNMTRPRRHTVVFSADITLPLKHMWSELFLNNDPVEIRQVGCCTLGVLDRNITQLVEVVRPNERFSRLLQLLGEWYEKGGKILILLKSPRTCNAFCRDLLEHGYPSLLLHGDQNQADKNSNLSDFKSNKCNLVIATSDSVRGLVDDLQLVINYDDVSSLYSDYVHKVSHAASNGCAVTFLSTEEGRYAPILVKALNMSSQAVPDDLKDLADGFKARVKEFI